MTRRTSMQVSIENILKAHGLLDAFRSGDEFHARFEREGYQSLVIEHHGDRVCVAHTFIQYGDLMYDPEIVFHYDTWSPLEITQSPVGVYRRKFVVIDGKEYVDTRFDYDVGHLVRVWAKNLRWQRWENAAATSLTHPR